MAFELLSGIPLYVKETKPPVLDSSAPLRFFNFVSEYEPESESESESELRSRSGSGSEIAASEIEAAPGSEIEAAPDSEVESEAQRLAPPTPEVSGDVPPPQGKIIYTFQYDLESVWWIILWTLLARVAHAPGQNYAPFIFVNRLENTPERQSIFSVQGRLRSQLTSNLHTDLRSRFAGPMDDFCTELRQAYREREQAEEVMEPTSYAKIYNTMMLFLTHCNRSSIEGVPDLVSLL